MNQKIAISKSGEETKELGIKFARLNLQQGSTLTQGGTLTKTIALYGELGSGKTTFVQGLAKGLGIKRRIISPTFIIIRNYELITHPSQLFYHIDLYRVETEHDIKGLGINEILNEKNAIVVIEWAEKLGDLLPKKRIDIYFEHVSENERKITVEFKN